jgi:hypothetical protein
MAHGIQSKNSYTLKHTANTDNPNQLDTLFFTDFHQASNTVNTVPLEGGVFYFNSLGSATLSNNNTAILTAFGITAASGTVQLQTGTTSNNNAAAAIATGGSTNLAMVPGIPTPTTGLVTKYEWEALIRTGATIFNGGATLGGAFRFGLMDSTQASISNGVYYEFLNNGTTNDTTFNLVWRAGSSQERFNTGATYDANKTYRLYMSIEANTAGTVTTTYKIKNFTDGTNTEGTATPANTARIPTSITAYCTPVIEINRDTSTTTTSIVLNLDYLAYRIRRPVSRELIAAL